MREIKFRIWDGHTKSFFDTPDTHYQPKLKIDESGIMSFETKDELYEIQQFTGLLDKNGKEIYDGDVITCVAYQREQTVLGEYRPEKVQVKYQDGYFYPFGYNAGWRSEVTDIEVIGNIYENPELLK